MKTPDVIDHLTTALTGPLAEIGLDLEAVELTRAGKHSVLRVAVDRDGGVDMDAIAEATRLVSAELDESDSLGSAPYTLEVSSPGVDRPLTLPRHWRRNQGRLVKVTLTEGPAIEGRIRSSDDDSAVLLVADAEVVVGFAEIKKAKIQIEFKPLARDEEE